MVALHEMIRDVLGMRTMSPRKLSKRVRQNTPGRRAWAAAAGEPVHRVSEQGYSMRPALPVRTLAAAVALGLLPVCCTRGPTRLNAPGAGRITATREIPLGDVQVLWSGGPRHAMLVLRRGVVGMISEKQPKLEPLFGSALPESVGGRRRVGSRRLKIFAGPAVAATSGRYIAVLSLDLPPLPRSAGGPMRFGSWQVWSVARRECVGRLSSPARSLQSYTVPPRGPLRVVFTDGDRRIVGCDGGGLLFFDFNGGRLRLNLSTVQAEHAYRLVPNRSGGDLFAAACALPGRVEIWNGATERRVVIIPPPAGVSWGIVNLLVSLRGRRCAVSWGRDAAVYNAETGRRLAEIRLGGDCEGIALSKQGRELATCVRVGPSTLRGKAAHLRQTRSRLFVFRLEPRPTIFALSRYSKADPGPVSLRWLGQTRIVESTARRLTFWRVSNK